VAGGCASRGEITGDGCWQKHAEESSSSMLREMAKWSTGEDRALPADRLLLPATPTHDKGRGMAPTCSQALSPSWPNDMSV